MGLMTFTDRFPGKTLRDHAAHYPSSVGDRALPAEGIALKVAAVARVNAGRWIADCPQPGCNGAEFVSFDNPLFFCCECRNAGVKHLPIKIELPTDKLREAVEAALLVRPVPKTRNWTREETVKMLTLENELHGDA